MMPSFISKCSGPGSGPTSKPRPAWPPRPSPQPRPPAPPPTDALVIMMDGWMLRHRGEDWGLQPADRAGDRVAWRECKSAVIARTAQAVNKNDRGLLLEKFVVAYLGEPLEFGRRVQAEARRRGLGQVAQ